MNIDLPPAAHLTPFLPYAHTMRLLCQFYLLRLICLPLYLCFKTMMNRTDRL